MNETSARTWGLVIGGALFIAALVVVIFSRAPAPIFSMAMADGGIAAPAMPAHRGAVSFIVRFSAPHPMAGAQTLEAQGRHGEARAAALAAIGADRGLQGLCFDHFTLGGAEIVLRTCAGVAHSRRAATERRWRTRFAQMDGVEYADVNAAVSPEGHENER